MDWRLNGHRYPALWHTWKQFLGYFLASSTVPVTLTSPSAVTFLYGKLPSRGERLLRYTLAEVKKPHLFSASNTYAALSWIRIQGETTTAQRLGSRSTRSNARVADTSPRLPAASQAATLSRLSSAIPSAASIKSRPASTHNRAPLARCLRRGHWTWSNGIQAYGQWWSRHGS